MSTSNQAHSPAEELLDAAKQAAADLGISDGVVRSIKIELSTRGGPVCPPPTSPVLRGRVEADGTIIYEYVCE